MIYKLEHWPTLPKISCQCITYGRPELLNEAVESFLRQDYIGEKELIILNDQPELKIISNIDNVKVYNLDERVSSIGEKRNICVSYCDGDIIFPWDDDDISLPWRISFSLENMKNKNYFKGDSFWFLNNENLSIKKNVAHAMGAFSKSLFAGVGQYPLIQSGQDIDLENKFKKTGHRVITKLKLEEIYYIYKFNGNGSYHLSWYGYTKGFNESKKFIEKQKFDKEYIINPRWKLDYIELIKNYKLYDKT